MPRGRLPDEITFLEVCPEACLEAFRTVHVPALDAPTLVESFRSNQARGKAPRLDEIQHPTLHWAISCWTDPAKNRALARMYPSHGSYIARLVLTFGHGFSYMDPSQDTDPDHRRVVGDPLQFVAATVEIFSV